MQQTKYKDNSSLKKSNNHKDNKKRGNKKQDNKDPRVSSTWATAPFNFIRFPEEVYTRYKNCDELPKFDNYNKNLNTGYIDYTFVNETPLFVGDEKGRDKDIVDFFRNSDNEICIPGSSLKGVIRSNTEILSFSYPEFVEDRLYLYRKFASADTSSKQYKDIIKVERGQSIDTVVKAGYIKKKGDRYYLYQAKKVNNKTFFPISERKLRQNNLPENKVKYMYTKELLNYKGKNGKDWDRFARNRYNLNRNYRPYSTSISFDIDSENHFKQISVNNSCKYKGILCNNNHLGSKSKHYIINEIDENSKPIEIDSREIIAYKNDCETNKQRTNSEYYLLPGEKYGNKITENPRPFFYIMKDNKVAYFGRSPYLRIFYKNSVRDCINTKYVPGIDYANAMYGYTVDKKQGSPLKNMENNFKSRISFMDAVCKNPKTVKEVKYFNLASPKSSCYNLYLDQYGVEMKKEINTYSSDSKPEIRGYKFYWHHKGDVDINKISLDKPSNITSNLRNIMKKGNEFSGKIYFQNLTDDELGLLLLSIKYNEKSRENLGMAKAYGLGRVNFDNIDLYLEKIENKFLCFNNNYEKIDDIQYYKYKYMDFIEDNHTKVVYNKLFEEIDEINDYLDSKEALISDEYTKYMTLNEFTKEYRLLPEVYKVVEG